MCGGFTCSKNCLIGLNIFYIVVSITLISVAAYAKVEAIVTSTPVVSGIILCGVLLLLLSLVGIIAASRHHQVWLFFYMVVLFITFIIQFSVACACLSMNTDQQEALAVKGWKAALDQPDLILEAEQHFHCCGVAGDNSTTHCNEVTQQPDSDITCCPDTFSSCCDRDNNGTAIHEVCKCGTCNRALQEAINSGLTTVGGIGMFFSFTEVIGFFVAKRYRYQIEPREYIQSLVR